MSRTWGCLALNVRSTSSLTSSMGFMSADYAGQGICWGICYSSLLLIYPWQNLLVYFGSLSCMSTNPWATSRVPDGIAWYCSTVIGGLIQFALNLVQIFQHHNKTCSILYGWCDTEGYSSFTNCSLHIDPPIWAKDFELLFVSPKDFIPLFCCPIFARLGPPEPFDIVLLPQQWFLDSNSFI